MARPFLPSTTRLSDSYKLSHWKQYPPGTETIYSYLEARNGARFDKTVFYGLQYILQAYMEGQVVTPGQVARDAIFSEAHFFGDKEIYNKEGWSRIATMHDGRLPLRIMALPEGTVIGNSQALMTVENLDPNLPWLTNYFESLLLHVWYPITVASLSRACKEIWYKYLEKTGDPAGIAFKHHDFGFRGVESVESAGIGGSAHLVNFKGTDTKVAIDLIFDYYSGTTDKEIAALSLEKFREFVLKNMAGFSIPASEHSTMTSWGEERELDACRNMLVQYPRGFVACVSDSWDINRACEVLWGQNLKAEIVNRPGTLVVRPDSGDPIEKVPEISRILGKEFGFVTNSKGYKVIDGHIRGIQGDGIEVDTVDPILKALTDDGWSADNWAMGSGGGLLQKVNRDTQRMAFKCSHAVINGKGVDVFKRPASDPSKNSKRGKFAVVFENGQYRTIALDSAPLYKGGNRMIEVFNRGVVKNLQSFSDIRDRAELPELKQK